MVAACRNLPTLENPFKTGFPQRLQAQLNTLVPTRREPKIRAAALGRCGSFLNGVAAVRIASITRLGFESMGTWLLLTSYVLAPMRFAMKRCNSGRTVRSFVATM